MCAPRGRPYELQDTFLNMLRISEFRIKKSTLFHSITAEGKNKFLKKLCLI